MTAQPTTPGTAAAVIAAPAAALPTLTEAISAIRSGTLSPVELTERILSRIDRLDPLVSPMWTSTRSRPARRPPRPSA
jgi:Asp-tRNA(Asn)/Glu-tRNA(Gln) amidotransferase A subunit family amidase